MRSLFGLNLKTVFVILGVLFFGVTLYSDELIASLENLGVISSLKPNDDKQNVNNQEVIKSVDFDLLNQNLSEKNLELSQLAKKIKEGESELSSQTKKKKLLNSELEKLKFELVDIENKKKLLEANSINLAKKIGLSRS
jgi:hypothetical protein